MSEASCIEILRALIKTREGTHTFEFLDKGIGTETPDGKAWLSARYAVHMADMAANKDPFITTTQGMDCWFAVHVWWNPEGFWEPWDTGLGRYADESQAITEAKHWAALEEIEYRPREIPAPA